jgi:HSP20 family molecular chaperone IbpA
MKPVRSIDQIWTQACELLDRADRMHRQFFRLSQAGQIPVWEPPLDIFESGPELLVRVAVPDINLEDFKISLEGTALRLSGRRCLPKEASQRTIRRLEIPYGLMERCVTLPPGRYRLTAHAYNNGCLEIQLQRMSDSG